jgi:hypothetical protein
MWLRFLKQCEWIEPDRRAFYFIAGAERDVPALWAQKFLAEQGAVEIPPPDQPAPVDPAVLASLGDAPLTVVCVHKTGGIYDGHDYVGRLARGVARNLTTPYRFVCLSDDPAAIDGVEKIPLQNGWRGYWSKVEIYRPGLFSGPVLYLDLDTVICGDLGDIAACPDPVIATWDLQRGWINSSLLRWSVDLSCVYQVMLADPAAVMKKYDNGTLYGDQGLLQDTLTANRIAWRWAQEACREQILWIAPPLRGTPPPANTRVALFYGAPKLHEISSPWLAANWR